jgi:serine/threonine-protein kinase ATR
VCSMVGAVVGLGDRHGENILVDERSGELVHVDYDCLFDKALQLREPELVPFRLTPNVIDGVGVMGVEGLFRRSCEASMAVLRANHDTLISVLQSFVFDPLSEWKDQSRATAQTVLDCVENRLKGHNQLVARDGKRTDAPLGPPLSVAGQVQELIAAATERERLAVMYIGWMPWV